MAARIRALESLPYIVGVNPFISRLYTIYRESLDALLREKEVTTLEENDEFVRRLQGLVESHANDIPIMAKGFQECKRYMTPSAVSAFLDGAIRSRIGTRLIGEQHVAISRSLSHPTPGQVGVVQTDLKPREMIQHCAAFVAELCESTLGVVPQLVVDGMVDATFSYIPVHLEYILTELLKNAYRATAEHHLRLPTPTPPSITLTLSRTPSFLSFRIRDGGGGIAPAHLAHVFSYAFTTAGVEDGGPYAMQHVGGQAALDAGAPPPPSPSTSPSLSPAPALAESVFTEISATSLRSSMGTIAGLGYGLPLARLYASYFGGGLELVSLYGHGTDVFVKLRSLEGGADVLL
ncbi:alpha-ketoacid dehydrogenase kinase N-terminal domain-containing protein [Dacryopinax primogenitus]|uniref:Protein-serine/threonine kinase n=1 Tax=Dacryopinax primogenitus (strain DJM 731) TaxID=1858805 RepID=M5GAE1_DACPD|nr:alpha-ketoacid dehydrogenase kinase N-terminal domain-containing protein [Dacryopinax primogenitus]EJU05310.1 alpha-ketoacid dehydrogenase kinase N-terminal domain-containing protein [Dacryopinax primogenitus]